MANITIQIPDASLNRVINGICDAYEYDRAIMGMPSPPTKTQFAKSRIIEFIKSTVRSAEVNIATRAAESTVSSEIDGIGIT